VTDLFDSAAEPEPSSSEVQHLFVDEAGTPTLFHESGKAIADTYGCSRFFILGKLEVENPMPLDTALTELRQEMLTDPLFAGTESFKPERKKTALAFHAKDDLPEVRFRVFDLLRSFDNQLRFCPPERHVEHRRTDLQGGRSLTAAEPTVLEQLSPRVPLSAGRRRGNANRRFSGMVPGGKQRLDRRGPG